MEVVTAVRAVLCGCCLREFSSLTPFPFYDYIRFL